MDDDQYTATVGERKVAQGDVTRFGAFEKFKDICEPLFQSVSRELNVDGVFLRVQLARMMPGTEIKPHIDTYKVLINCHRLHIPIITNEKIQFVVDNERIKMDEGNLYELNNQLTHSVVNPKDGQPRIHLIMDFLPDNHNIAESVDDNFKFRIREKQAKKNHKKRAAIDVEMPKVIATSVVRGANQDESHGGVYLVDMQREEVNQVIDWNTCDIDFSGRGWDRGLRGICILKKDVYIAASDEIFQYTNAFDLKKTYKNQYLKHAHEMVIDGRFLYVTSTGFDSILRFNIRKQQFDLGWQFYLDSSGLICVRTFDPLLDNQVTSSNIFHINSVLFLSGKLYVSGRNLFHLLDLANEKVQAGFQLPLGTHNVILYNKGIIYNDTNSNKVVYCSDYDYRSVDVVGYDESKIENYELRDDVLARPRFGRGLCPYIKGTVIAGSSPSTISLIDFKSCQIVKSVNISMDVRNSIHGLEVWPF